MQRESDKATLEKVQRLTQHGFSSRELKAMEVVPSFWDLNDPESNVASTLGTIDILEVFEQDRWLSEKTSGKTKLCKHIGAIPILGLEDGKEAYWVAEEPIVWAILRPILQFASLVLANDEDAKVYGWLDALLNRENEDGDTQNQYTKIGNNAVGDLYRLRARKMDAKTLRLTKERIAHIGKSRNIVFTFHSAYASYTSWFPNDDKAGLRGVTTCKDILRRTEISLAIELFQPLLMGGLSHSERLAIQFDAACTLLHEFAHGAYRAIEGAAVNEPYYEDEPLAELGFSTLR